LETAWNAVDPDPDIDAAWVAFCGEYERRFGYTCPPGGSTRGQLRVLVGGVHAAVAAGQTAALLHSADRPTVIRYVRDVLAAAVARWARDRIPSRDRRHRTLAQLLATRDGRAADGFWKLATMYDQDLARAASGEVSAPGRAPGGPEIEASRRAIRARIALIREPLKFRDPVDPTRTVRQERGPWDLWRDLTALVAERGDLAREVILAEGLADLLSEPPEPSDGPAADDVRRLVDAVAVNNPSTLIPRRRNDRSVGARAAFAGLLHRVGAQAAIPPGELTEAEVNSRRDMLRQQAAGIAKIEKT
jgi:hypothetical protein